MELQEWCYYLPMAPEHGDFFVAGNMGFAHSQNWNLYTDKIKQLFPSAVKALEESNHDQTDGFLETLSAITLHIGPA